MPPNFGNGPGATQLVSAVGDNGVIELKGKDTTVRIAGGSGRVERAGDTLAETDAARGPEFDVEKSGLAGRTVVCNAYY